MRTIESLVSDADAHVDQKVMGRIEGFIDYLAEELDYINEKVKLPKVNSEPMSAAEKRKRTGNGNVSTDSESGSEQKRSRKRIARIHRKIDDDDVDVQKLTTHSTVKQYLTDAIP